jgi:hypothetical protein
MALAAAIQAEWSTGVNGRVELPSCLLRLSLEPLPALQNAGD